MDELIHRSQHRVLYGDTDAAAVVYNANYLRYFELGRTEFMRDRVCTYREIEQMGIVLPVTECHIRFKAPARYDDLLIIETILTDLKKVTCTFSYRILREEDGAKPRLLAKGFTTHASISREGKLTSLPMEIVKKLQPFLPNPAPSPGKFP
ncbi:MAG: thioesterase family protein [Deltaproteobacteria bacterium]|nr:thioesterase family protein [Deltaproteobacteria bacterium]